MENKLITEDRIKNNLKRSYFSKNGTYPTDEELEEMYQKKIGYTDIIKRMKDNGFSFKNYDSDSSEILLIASKTFNTGIEIMENSSDHYYYSATIKIVPKTGFAYISITSRKEDPIILECSVDYKLSGMEEVIRLFNGFSETLKLKELFWL